MRTVDMTGRVLVAIDAQGDDALERLRTALGVS